MNFLLKADERGFTLIELMIAIAIVAILAGISVPIYRGSIDGSYRSDAKSALVEMTHFMERVYSTNNTYAPAGDEWPDLPITEAPANNPQYNLSIQGDAADNEYTLQAVPIVGGSMAGDVCGTFTINQIGERGFTGADGTESDCW